MRRVGMAALLLASGASCATAPNHAPAVARVPSADSHFKVVESERGSRAESAVATTGRLGETPSAASVAEVSAEVLPAGYQDAPLPPPAPALNEIGAAPSVTSPSGPGLTLDQAIGMAFAANPSIAEADYTVRRSQGEWTQIGLSPNPVAGYLASEVGQEDQIGQQGVFAQQTIVTGNKLGLNRAVSAGDVASARAESEAQRLRVQTDVQTRYYEALGAQRLVEIARQTEENAAQSLEATRRLVEAGESTRADLLLAEAVFERSGVSTREAEARARGAWRQLAAMMGSPNLTPQPLAGELQTDRRADDFEAIWLHLRATSPELRRASARVSRARARIGRERAQNVPDVDAQVGVQQDAVTNYTLGFAQIGVMLPVHQRNQGAIAAAQAEYCREIKSFERLELDLRDRLAQSVRDAEVAAQQVETYGEKVVPAAAEGLGLIREGYARGEFDVLRLVTAQQTYADALLEFVQAQIDLQRSLATLDGLLLTGGLSEPGQPKGVDTPETLTEVPKAQ